MRYGTRDIRCILLVQKNFVLTVRAVEAALGVGVSGSPFPTSQNQNATASIIQAVNATNVAEIAKVLADAAPILVDVVAELGAGSILFGGRPSRTPLVTKYGSAIFLQNRSS